VGHLRMNSRMTDTNLAEAGWGEACTSRLANWSRMGRMGRMAGWQQVGRHSRKEMED